MSDYDLGERLIFLVSQPRSGSTLLQQVLGSHPAVHTLPEPWIMLHPLYALRESGIRSEYDSQLAGQALRHFLSRIGKDESFYRAGIHELAVRLYDAALAGTGKQFFLDKTPRYYFIVPELRRMFPGARFVILLRNPLAVLASILELWKTRGWDLTELFSTDARHDLMTAPELILEALDALGDNTVVVRYEELAESPERVVRGVCAGLGLEFHEEMLDYGSHIQRDRKGFGDEKSIYLHDRPVAAYRDSWIERLRTPQRRDIALNYLRSIGRDVVGRLGYDFDELERAIVELKVPGAWKPVIPWRLLQRPWLSRLQRYQVNVIRKFASE